MKCLNCKANMVKHYTDYILTSNPPQKPWEWYCGCGNKEHGGVDTLTFAPSIREIWEQANPIKPQLED